jgi:hypothetical protein
MKIDYTQAKELCTANEFSLLEQCAPPLSLKRQTKQKSILSGQRMDVSGKNSRVRGHVSAQGRRKQAVRQSRNG